MKYDRCAASKQSEQESVFQESVDEREKNPKNEMYLNVNSYFAWNIERRKCKRIRMQMPDVSIYYATIGSIETSVVIKSEHLYWHYNIKNSMLYSYLQQQHTQKKELLKIVNCFLFFWSTHLCNIFCTKNEFGFFLASRFFTVCVLHITRYFSCISKATKLN